MTDKLEPKTKRYSLSAEEKMNVENIQSVMGIISMLRTGMNHSLGVALTGVRHRLGIKDSEAPEGYSRDVTFDPDTSEVVVIDTPLDVVVPKVSPEVAEDKKPN